MLLTDKFAVCTASVADVLVCRLPSCTSIDSLVSRRPLSASSLPSCPGAGERRPHETPLMMQHQKRAVFMRTLITATINVKHTSIGVLVNIALTVRGVTVVFSFRQCRCLFVVRAALSQIYCIGSHLRPRGMETRSRMSLSTVINSDPPVLWSLPMSHISRYTIF